MKDQLPISVSVSELTSIRHGLHHLQGSCARAARRHKIKLELNQDLTKGSYISSDITGQCLCAARTAAELCSLGIRVLRMQRFINSPQIGPKVFEILPDASHFLPSSRSLRAPPSVYSLLCLTYTQSLSYTTMSLSKKNGKVDGECTVLREHNQSNKQRKQSEVIFKRLS